MLYGAFQFESAATYVSLIVAQYSDGSLLIGGRAGLHHLLLVHQDASGKDQGLGALARWRQPTLHQ